MDFTSDDGFYRSATAASAFSTALQTELLGFSAWDWVERQQVQMVVCEQETCAYGLSSANSALRIGRMLKADLLIVGRFSRNEKEGHTLRMEIVDADRADVLATRSISIPGDRRDPITFDSKLIEQATAAMREAVKEAKELLARTKNQVVIAPLFFRNVDSAQRLNSFEEDLLNEFSEASTTTNGFRVLRLLGAHEAAGEAELAMRGLSDADPEAWQDVADVYVWGSYTELKSEGLAFHQVPVETTIYLWDGHGSARKFTETGTVGELRMLASGIARRVFEVAGNRSTGPMMETARVEVARTLAARAREMQQLIASYGNNQSAFLQTRHGQSMTRYAMKVLQTACFFAPQDAQIQKEWLEALSRWPQAYSTMNRFWHSWFMTKEYDGYLDKFPPTEQSPLSSWAVNRCSDSYRDLLQQFQYRYEHHGFPIDVPAQAADQWQAQIVAEFTTRVVQLTGLAGKSTEKHAKAALASRSGEWLHMGLKSARDGRQRERLIEGLWPYFKPSYVQAAQRGTLESGYTTREVPPIIRSTYTDLGKPERAIELLDVSAPEPTSTVPPQPAQIAKSTSKPQPQKKAPAQSSPSAPPQPSRPLPERTIVPAIVPFPHPDAPLARVGMHRVTILRAQHQQYDELTIRTLNVCADKLWFSTVFGQPSLWSYDPARDALVNVTEIIGAHSEINTLHNSNARLWMTLQFDGVWCLEPATLEVKRYNEKDGVLKPTMSGIASVPGRLFFGAGNLLNSFDVTTGHWGRLDVDPLAPAGQRSGSVGRLGSYKQWLVLDAGRVFFWDPKTGAKKEAVSMLKMDQPIVVANLEPSRWQKFKSYFSGDSGSSPIAPLPPKRPRFGSLRALAADETGMWFGTSTGLYRANPDTDQTELWNTPNFAVAALAHDGEFLWVAVLTADAKPAQERQGMRYPGDTPKEDGDAGETTVLALHKPTGKWVGKFPVRARVNSMVVHRSRLWLGLDRGITSIIEVDQRQLQVSMKIGTTQPGQNQAVTTAPSAGGSDAADLLMSAAYDGKAETVKQLLANGSKASTQTLDGWTALMSASRGGRNDIVSLLIDSGAEVNSKTKKEGITALIIAGEFGHKQVVETLLRHKAELEDKDVQGRTALMAAVTRGNTDAISFLLDKGADVDTKDKRGRTTLMTALEARDVEAMRALLKRTGRVDEPDARGNTALIRAMEDNYDEAIAALLERGASVKKQNNDGTSPFLIAVRKSDTRRIQSMLDKGADINIRDRNDGTPLMAAIERGDTEVVKLLLAKGANVNARDRSGGSALSRAASNEELAKLLTEHGAIQNLKTTDATAVRNGAKEPAKTAIRSGNLNVDLVEAVKLGDTARVQALLQQGAEPDARDNSQWPVIALAAEKGKTETVRALLEAGAKPDLKGPGGWTALMQAAGKGRNELVKLLLEKGASTTQKNDFHRTAADIARARNYPEIAKLVEDHSSLQR